LERLDVSRTCRSCGFCVCECFRTARRYIAIQNPATDRGRDGYKKYTHDFAKLIWRTASPKWEFDDATFDRSAAAFENPDHVDITIHNYRWRLGLAPGEAKYDEYEAKLVPGPAISVPTITLEGDANGAPHAPPSAYASSSLGNTSTVW
jgi:hypothetical protein